MEDKIMVKWNKRIKLLIVPVAAVVILLIICFLFLKNKPSSQVILLYMEETYKRDFQIVEEFTHIDYTDGEIQAQRELKCPAVVLQDKNNADVCFIAYAYPLEGGGWVYRDNYFQKVLVYCIKQQQIELNNEDKCKAIDSSCPPKIVLENTDEMARKLQNMVLLFTELCQYDDDHNINVTGCFQVEGSMFVYQIQQGNVGDRWLDATGPFCYDSPIEKYKAFLDKLDEE